MRPTQSHWSYRTMIPLAHASAWVIVAALMPIVWCADLYWWAKRKRS